MYMIEIFAYKPYLLIQPVTSPSNAEELCRNDGTYVVVTNNELKSIIKKLIILNKEIK